MKSLKDGLELLPSPAFAPAFNGSTNVDDYRWGKLTASCSTIRWAGHSTSRTSNATYGFANLSAQLPGLARPGGYEVVDDSDHSVRANTLNGFMFGSGPARRFVGEMTATPTLRQILPGGQSGVLGSPFYASQLGRWLTNQYKPLNISVATATQNPLTQLDFVPRQ